jgi:DNA topoisomerase VI subunit B
MFQRVHGAIVFDDPTGASEPTQRKSELLPVPAHDHRPPPSSALATARVWPLIAAAAAPSGVSKELVLVLRR